MPARPEPLWRRYLRFLRPDIAADVDDELRFHLEMREAEYRARGMSPDEARATARRRFGDLDHHRRLLRRQDERRHRRARWGERLGDWGRDLRVAARGLARQPGFALVAIVTLGLGIGATATMFSILDRLLLSAPPHVKRPAELRRLLAERRGEGGATGISPELNLADLGDLRRATRSFAQVAAWQGDYDFVLGRGADAVHLTGAIATHDFFPLLGVRPQLGRFFDASEDRPGSGARVVVLGHGFWRRQFGADPGMVGREVEIGGVSHRVLGVAPPDFTGVDLAPVDIWMPMLPWADDAGNLQGEPWRLSRRWSGIYLVGRLRPGVAETAAAAEATATWRSATDGTAAADSTFRIRLGSVIAARGIEGPTADARIALWLGGVTVLVLLVAVSNVATLMLSRAVQRRREGAVRLALGVTRWRLLRSALVEAMLVALGAALVAAATATWGAGALRAVLLSQIAPLEGWASPAVFGVVAAVALAAAVLAAMVPVLAQERVELAGELRQGATDGRARSRTRAGLMLVQTTLTVVLLVGSGLFIRSLDRVRSLDLGIEPERVMVAFPRYSASANHTARLAVLTDAMARLATRPGILGVAATGSVHFRSNINGLVVRSATGDSLPLPPGGPYLNAVSPGYFATVGTTLQRGRDFAAADGPGAAPVAILNATMARLVATDGDPLGDCLQIELSTGCWTVVGVVEDSRVRRFNETPAPQVFLPATQWTDLDFWPQALVVRTATPPTGHEREVREALLAASPAVAYVDILPLAWGLDPQLRPYRLGATMFTVFGVLALLIAAVGLYGVVAHGVARRQREMGIRMALGARPQRVLAMVLGEGIRTTGAGVAAGLGVALLAGRFLAPLLFDTSPRDPLVLGAVAATLLLAALAAGLVPARRATRVDPAVTLREE